MTPQERQLVDDLFDRLARLETARRDPEAERAIIDGLNRAPSAVYALVQTVLVQEEALRRADARIRELGGGEPVDQDSPSFLDSMREAFTGRSRTSVPSVRANAANQSDTRWNTGGAYAGAAQAQGSPAGAAPPAQGAGFGGGSFLGTAAASAAGVIGGSLLLNSISSMFGNRGGSSAFASTPSGSNSPWDNSAGSGDLAREAGLNDVGGRGGNDPQAAGLFGNDDTYNDNHSDDLAGDPGGDFDGGDFGGGDFGGGDTA